MDDVLRYDIPMMAVKAAIELDLLIAEKSIGNKSIKKLTDYIGSKVMLGNKVSSDHSSTDDLWLWRCLYDSSEKLKNSHVSQYALDLKLLHDEFSNFRSLSKDRLKNLSHFCCKLSQYAMAYIWQYSSPHISHVA